MAGRAYLYLGGPAGPGAAPDWTSVSAERGRVGASFALAVAGAGDLNCDGYADVAIGEAAHQELYLPLGHGFAGYPGRVLVYYGSADGLPAQPQWVAAAGQRGALFGHAVAAAGDVNGDGCGDLVIGAPLQDQAHADEGVAYLYLGSPSGLPAPPEAGGTRLPLWSLAAGALLAAGGVVSLLIKKGCHQGSKRGTS